ncbi:MAG: FAD-dependent oxidoreductase [Actinomycetota bacterium]|nr:FAD-dependent oxidoreductase [Actinomycetota bacterium]
MPKQQNVILGAGLAGLTAAYTLQQAGEDDWLVLEKESRPGGHTRSIELGGYVFDYGPHILFTNDPSIEKLVRDLLGQNLRSQERQAFIYHAAYGRYTRFPFQAHLFGLPTGLVKECLLGLVAALERQARDEFDPRNYEEWMRGFFGDGIAERLMIPYARKLWTVEPATMDFNWIGRRVPTPDVERILAGALTDDVGQVGATAQFWYPWRGGIEALPRALANRVANIKLECEVKRIDVRRRVLELTDGSELAFGDLIFTLPLGSLHRWILDLPSKVASACDRLQSQGILNVNLGIDRPSLSQHHWVYFYEDAFPFHRLSFPGNFSPHNVPPGKSSISAEVAFRAGSELDADVAVAATVDALQAAGILQREDVVELVHVEAIAPAYVIYDLKHTATVDIIVSWLRSVGIWPAGRFGEWQYFNMDHAMKSGRTAAHAVIAEARRSPVA